ncbi:Pilus assembly protein, PilO [Malonomonas rubra DSM 5091]|uniref:Pilus assembly protein, PilO n=1 Tax=Malonomonas rubra DSM 5091 TaxID=1122189 RepID=A0A1M6BCK0_MALRU|nr:type 4a pilus biogenesis protein PilO [Malonomonas rubra]SHI46470.1 Pilus assembly protein, PilO [Malonomonas rubra DSM 5091]
MKTALLKATWEQSRGWVFFILALILISLGLFIYQSQIVDDESAHLQQRRLELQQQLKVRAEKMAESGVPLSAVEQMEKDLLRFAELIPPKQEFSAFVGELFDLAQKSTLEIRQVNYQPEVDKETGFLKYGVSFSVGGSYEQVKKFIHLLENSSRILLIDNIGLAGRQTKEQGINVALQIKLTTFFQGGGNE